MAEKIILSGIKPTGNPHIGNYFGMMQQVAKLKANYAMIADYHALNFIQNGDELRRLIIDIAASYLAIGLDPKETIIFKQSDVSEHTELSWILGTLVPVPYLLRAHAYKDAEAKGSEVNTGTFTYPVLMAADILLYDTDVVPVGQDQKQHVEYARDFASKFNNAYGDTFKMPEEMILDEVKTVPGIDGRKMSKSYNNTIGLFASDDEIRKAVASIVTDSSEGIPQNVYSIHSLFRSKDDLEKIYEEHKGKYKNLKDILTDDVINFIKPMREKKLKLDKNPDYILQILQEGGEKAKEVASKKMSEVKRKIGVTI